MIVFKKSVDMLSYTTHCEAGLYYRKKFNLHNQVLEKRVWLEFEGVAGCTEVWVNHRFVAKHINPYTSFHIDITDYVKEGGNFILLHVDSRMKPCSRWYVGTGLYRSVWLHFAQTNAVVPHGLKMITKELKGTKATLGFEINVQGEDGGHNVQFSLEGAEGRIVVKKITEAIIKFGVATVDFDVNVEDIIPWSPQTPYLYKAKIMIDGLDTYEENIGIRTISVDPKNGFRLNGKKLKLKGGCIHHDLGILGAADHEEAEYRRIKLLKESGYNAIRLAHNPFSPTIFKICDRLGMLVVEEAFDEWVLGRTSFGSHLYFEERWEKDLEDMILRDFNHPSIVMWSTGNEVEERDGSADGYIWSKRLAEKVRNLDNTRPVSATACSLFSEYANQRPKQEDVTTGNQALNMAYDNFASGVDLWGKATAEYFAPVDVAGYNYKTARYAYDAEKFPNRVIYGSESYPRAAFLSWQAAVENDNVIGDFVWTAWDYIGEVGVGRWEISENERPGNPDWPWLLSNCSDIDLIGEKRPQSYYRDAIWENNHAPHLFTLAPDLVGKHLARLSWAWLPVKANYTFSESEGEKMEAHVYANADEVELILNGESIGTKACGLEQEYQAVFTFSYIPGSLEVIAYKDGRECGRDILRTADETNYLKLVSEKQCMCADGYDLCFVNIIAEDKDGIRVFGEQRKLTVNVQGGELLALGTADPKPNQLIPYKETSVSMFEGKALAVIRSRENTNECRIEVTLDGNISNTIVIPCNQPTEKVDTLVKEV